MGHVAGICRRRCERLQHAAASLLSRRTLASTSSSTAGSGYEATLGNLRIGQDTRVIFQGFTGKQSTINAKESLAWGTKIVGGVTPGRTGEHLGLPVFPNVRQAVDELKPDATGVYVAAHQAAGAIEEAVETEIPLIVAVAEHIPLHDILRIHAMLRTQSKSRLVGANTPGIISAVGRCRIGFQPLPFFQPGRVGIVAKSGTLSYEAVASTTRSGLGQSLCIGVGGDIIAGTDLHDGLTVLVEDEDTDAIVLIGEIGGAGELEAAEWIKEYHSRVPNPKPIAALVAGEQAVPGRIMGHAGAFTLLNEPSVQTKRRALADVGVTLVNHPQDFGPALVKRLEGYDRSGSSRAPAIVAVLLLEARGVEVKVGGGPIGQGRWLTLSINRSRRSPVLAVSRTTKDSQSETGIQLFPVPYGSHAMSDTDIAAIAAKLGLASGTRTSLCRLIGALIDIFHKHEAYLLEVVITETKGALAVHDAHFGFDDAAFRSCKRQADIQAMRDVAAQDAQEVNAEQYGITFVKLPGPGRIGTLVNGAGLAMNTVDMLVKEGGTVANFLDTGGKATSETVKHSFEAILSDARVRVVFVNIFGGLTMGDMIARGVILAFRELKPTVPVVVRIRGTNEKEGQAIIMESGLPLFAFDDFYEAARKAIELSELDL